jgi:hypothetical protein
MIPSTIRKQVYIAFGCKQTADFARFHADAESVHPPISSLESHSR